MGCFNSSGFMSKLPIRYGDRVVCFIALVNDSDGLYYPDSFISPFFLPIRGEYDDYGCVENIDRTVIVEMLEKYTNCDIEKILNGIERCRYGSTLKENIDYWKKANDEGINNYESEIAQYTVLLPLFTNMRKERLMEEFNKYLEKEGKEKINFPINDVKPVLLLEHEDIYDNFTNEFSKGDLLYEIFGTAETRFKHFTDSVGKVKEHYDELKGEGSSVVPYPTGHYYNFKLYEVFDGKEANEIVCAGEKLFGSGSESLQFFDKLTDEERLRVYDEAMDELRRYYCLFDKFASMPMYFSYSQTAGMQNYRYDIIREFYDVCSDKLNQEIDREKEEEEAE